MSDRARPEAAAFAELEQLVRSLGEELSGFRRRALQAESRLRVLETVGGTADFESRERVMALEAENAQLRVRLQTATERTRAMLDRVRFLRQQQARGGER